MLSKFKGIVALGLSFCLLINAGASAAVGSPRLKPSPHNSLFCTQAIVGSLVSGFEGSHVFNPGKRQAQIEITQGEHTKHLESWKHQRFPARLVRWRVEGMPAFEATVWNLLYRVHMGWRTLQGLPAALPIATPLTEEMAMGYAERLRQSMAKHGLDVERLSGIDLKQNGITFGYEMWGRLESGHHYNVPVFVRVGYLFFVSREWIGHIDSALRQDIGSHLIVVLPASMIFQQGISLHAAAAMVPWLSDSDRQGTHFVDLGSGDGLIALVASRRGAVRFSLFDNDAGQLERAKKHFALNQLDLVRGHFVLRSLEDTFSVVAALRLTKERMVVNINIGRWDNYPGIANATALEIVRYLTSVWKIHVGGYFIRNPQHREDYVREKRMAEQMGFVIDPNNTVRTPFDTMAWGGIKSQPNPNVRTALQRAS